LFNCVSESNRYPNVVQSRISFTNDCNELNVCDHASVPLYEMINSLNLVNWSFRVQCSAEHLVNICSMSSSPTPHSGHIGSTRPFEKRCLSFCTKYVPVNILHFAILFIISATFDGKEVQTRCVEPTFRSLVFMFLNDVLILKHFL
jgi:hypothetical protein